jgi:midasin (ATPase involved in ribosome maturation)
MLRSSIFSIRDILAWVKFIAKNYAIENEENLILTLNEAFLHGLQTVFIDALEMLQLSAAKCARRTQRDIGSSRWSLHP